MNAILLVVIVTAYHPGFEDGKIEEVTLHQMPDMASCMIEAIDLEIEFLRGKEYGIISDSIYASFDCETRED